MLFTSKFLLVPSLYKICTSCKVLNFSCKSLKVVFYKFTSPYKYNVYVNVNVNDKKVCLVFQCLNWFYK